MDKYCDLSRIGEGSFGRVYKATEIANKKTVALKVITKHGRSSKDLKNLRRECEIQRNLCHPNIIQMLDAFETHEKMVVVTEFAPGDLHKLLAKKGSLDEPRTQKLTYDLVSALYYLHSHRILHRDLKPQNILLDANQVAKLCDFGLARNMTMGTHVLTSIKGTPLYMAPELMAEKPYDHQADLWSLGCIIYEALAGQTPFSTHSIWHLVRLIKQENVKWPSFLSENCISFLKGLLEKDPSLRMAWSDILRHPFVQGHIVILNENIPDSPFTHPLTASQSREKKRQADAIINESSKMHQKKCSGATVPKSFPSDMLVVRDQERHRLKPRIKTSRDDDMISSRDSLNVILQSDLENIETDCEDIMMMAKRGAQGLIDVEQERVLIQEVRNVVEKQPNVNIYDGLKKTALDQDVRNKSDVQSMSAGNLDHFPSTPEREMIKKRNSVQEISLSMARMQVQERRPPTIHERSSRTEVSSMDNVEASKLHPPDVIFGGAVVEGCEESGEERHSLCIENDEWLAFIHRSMQEILDGEMESLKQQNLVSMIVAPLRNIKASCRVVESVAQLLSLPLVLGGPPAIIQEIRNVFIEVKLVPNLVYASKLLCQRRQAMYDKRNGNPSYDPLSNMSPQNTITQVAAVPLCPNLDEILTEDDIKTLSCLYELVCHLIHLNDCFLTQFCDALAILGANNLLVHFISRVSQDEPHGIRLAGTLLAVLSCTLREMPENADLVEKIIFDEKINLLQFLGHSNRLLRYRTCMLLRILGRFSCYALQTKWTVEIGAAMELLLMDADDMIRKEAEVTLEELRQLSFYTPSPTIGKVLSDKSISALAKDPQLQV